MSATPAIVPDDSLFSSPSAMSDITLVVDGRNLHVSKCVLGLASPVFLKMFEEDFKDRTEIPLADKKYEDMVELLLCMYPSTSKPITEDNLHAVLPLADEYGIESMRERCEAFILILFQLKKKKYNDPSNKELVHFLYLADKYKLKKLLEVCVEKVKFRTYDGENGIKCLSDFQLMSVEVKCRVLSERVTKLENPMKDMLKKCASLDKKIKVTLDKPTCRGCRISDPYYHDRSSGCNNKLTEEVITLLHSLSNMNIQFHKDPDIL